MAALFDKQSSSRCSVTQTVASGAASATSAAFGTETYQIRVAATAACYYKVVEAAGGAAASTDVFLPNNWVEYINVSPGQKISAIQAPTGGLVTATVGVLNVTEMC